MANTSSQPYFFDLISFSFYIYRGNYRDFLITFEKFSEYFKNIDIVSDKATYLTQNLVFSREITRMIYNYSASFSSLVDHTRRSKEKLEEHPLKRYRDFIEEYDTKLDSSVKNCFENIFIKDLRNYIQHKQVAVPSLIASTQCNEKGQSIDGISDFLWQIPSIQMQNYRGWKSKSKKYLQENEYIPIVEIFKSHFKIIENFYFWLQFRDSQLTTNTLKTLPEMSFEEYKEKNEMWDERLIKIKPEQLICKKSS